jgi:hypothetical protein
MRVRFERLLEQMAKSGQAAGSKVSTAAPGPQNVRGLEEVLRAKQAAGDRITIGLGVALAVVAVALPIYVIQTSDGRPDLPVVLPTSVGSIPVNRSFAASRAGSATFDPTTTGAVPKDGAGVQQAKRPDAGTGAQEPPPKRYVVRGVSDGVALVEGPEGLWAVMPGATLPGAGRIQSIEKSGKGWVVVTSETTISQPSL